MNKSVCFLGTSHGEPSRTRFCSSTLYTFGENRLLIDAGEPVSALLIRQGIAPGCIGAVAITHFHLDHVNGLFQLTYQMGKYPVEGVSPTVLFPEERNIPPFLAWRKATYSETPLDNITLAVFPPQGQTVFLRNNRIVPEGGPDTVKISSINGRHLWRHNARAQAFFIEADNLRIVHTGDLLEKLEDFPVRPGDRSCDVCVCESTHFYWDLADAMAVLARAPLRRLIFNHVSPHWTDGNEHKLTQLAAALPYPVEIARDGMVAAL
ncbi:MAG: MBL fold metallo-hydrolase [Victivallales bacterium]|nr:MBL fold metallo-hydrolase [Victivallales bacterium]